MSLIEEMNDLLLDAEEVGVLGSPSSNTSFYLDFREEASRQKLIGETLIFSFSQDGQHLYALGQVAHVTLRNPWHEEPGIRTLIRQRGKISSVSEVQDVHTGLLDVNAVFSIDSKDNVEGAILGTVPPTGTILYYVNEDILQGLLAAHQDKLFYLGHSYGSEYRLPFLFRHFGAGEHGAGEAYHLGIFGKTGSGKSVLAKMMLLAYARHKDMALIVIDPQGEFSRDINTRNSSEGFTLPLGPLLKELRPGHVHTPNVTQLALDRWSLFEDILQESRFMDRVSIATKENRELATDLIRREFAKQGVKLSELYKRQTFDKVWELLNSPQGQNYIYRSAVSLDRFRRAVNAIQEPEQTSLYENYWLPLTNLFKTEEKKRTIENTLNIVLDQRKSCAPIIIIDLSERDTRELLWTEKTKNIVIKRLIDGLVDIGQSYYREGKSCNALILIDEAHRLAPSGPLEEENAAVKSALVDAIRTTRKYGLGWMFISQSISSLHSEIIQQLRIKFFGFGLGMGNEGNALGNQIGNEAHMNLYRSFPDPHASLSKANRRYSFMSVGPVSPLTASGHPLFFSAFNDPESLIKNNGLKYPRVAASSNGTR